MNADRLSPFDGLGMWPPQEMCYSNFSQTKNTLQQFFANAIYVAAIFLRLEKNAQQYKQNQGKHRQQPHEQHAAAQPTQQTIRVRSQHFTLDSAADKPATP